MTTAARAALLSVIFLCGLEEAALAQLGHCAGGRCFVLVERPEDFAGARTSCNKSDGQLFAIDKYDALKTLTAPRAGDFWLELRGDGAGGKEPDTCTSVSVSERGLVAPKWRPCRDKLDGFLCQNTMEVPCSRAHAAGGAQVRYVTHDGGEVADSELFTAGTMAVAGKSGDKYPDSKHLCYAGSWLPAPWNCEVLSGGCERGCAGAPRAACKCSKGEILHANNISCVADPCTDCAQGCRREGEGRVCTCLPGYKLAQDGRSCADVDECAGETRCAGEGERCVNTPGGYECGCKDGFEMDAGECVDLICLSCEQFCEKRDGRYGCACVKGFKVSPADPTKCEQHCTSRDCPARCVKSDETKEDCFCPEGYIKDVRNDSTLCTDINECEMDKPCDHRCENLFGSYRCLPADGEPDEEPGEEPEGGGSGAAAPPAPTPRGAHHAAAVPAYVKSGSALGIAVFALLCAALLLFFARRTAKRCGKFQLASLRHPDIDIFYLQQVTTETYKRLSFDKQSKNDVQRQ